MQAARDRKLMPDQMSGVTFTLSNIGGLGGGHVTSILPPATSGILTLGRAAAASEARTVPLSLTVDHRLVDGGPAARFISRVAAELEGDRLFSLTLTN